MIDAVITATATAGPARTQAEADADAELDHAAIAAKHARLRELQATYQRDGLPEHTARVMAAVAYAAEGGHA